MMVVRMEAVFYGLLEKLVKECHRKDPGSRLHVTLSFKVKHAVSSSSIMHVSLYVSLTTKNEERYSNNKQNLE